MSTPFTNFTYTDLDSSFVAQVDYTVSKLHEVLQSEMESEPVVEKALVNTFHKVQAALRLSIINIPNAPFRYSAEGRRGSCKRKVLAFVFLSFSLVGG